MSERAAPVLYTQRGCADSKRVRQWLTAHDVSFTERNVTGDPEAARALKATGVFATPLLVIGDTTIVGYRPAKLAEARASQ